MLKIRHLTKILRNPETLSKRYIYMLDERTESTESLPDVYYKFFTRNKFSIIQKLKYIDGSF